MAISQNAPVQGRISKIYDHLYANAPVKTPAAIAYEFGKIAHTCLYIEQNPGNAPTVSITRTENTKYKSGTSLFDLELSREIRESFNKMSDAWKIYEDDRSIRLSDYDICFCIFQLGDLRFSDPKSDLIGDIFEIMRSKFAKEKGGQFFTDPQVTHLAIRMLRFDPIAGDDLVDICAGTGGFLLAGMAHLEEVLTVGEAEGATDLLKRSFIGVEIDPDATEAANSTIRARFGSGVSAIVSNRDSLKLFWPGYEDNRIRERSHRCIATNPPFGTKITVKDPDVLSGFELSRLSARDGTLSHKLSPQAPDTLFLEQNLRLLKPETGRLAIVAPYQMLSGPQALGLRQWLLRNARVHGVVDLPADTFQPHTGTKGALLLVSSRTSANANSDNAKNERIFMSVPRHVGHDRRGNAIYRTDSEGRLSSEILSDFAEVGKAFDAFEAGNEPSEFHDQSFCVRLGDVLDTDLVNLNANFYLGRGTALARNERAGFAYQRLGELVEKIFYPTRFKRNFVGGNTPGAVPFMGGAGITEFITTGRKWLGPTDPNLERLRVQTGWILVTRSGSTGIVSTVPAEWNGYALSEHVIRIVPKAGQISAGYLYAVLSSSYGQDYLRRGIFGSVIDEITPEYLADLPIPIPKESDLVKTISSQMEFAETQRSKAMNAFSDAVNRINLLLK